ncbi:hypothetical protein H8E52_12415 [bacterium]|nr:hypothetical protein [bacterium]
MKPMRLVFSMLLIALALFIAGELFQPLEANARPRKCALVDDDWEPSEGKADAGKVRYLDDPEYEAYIIQALNLTGYDYDVFEIWPDGSTAPMRPSLADLTAYQSVIWNCAANAQDVLQEEEVVLLVDYMNLGGKVLLSGQGIMDFLVEQDGNPLYDLFRNNILGVDTAFLNFFTDNIQAIPFGYFADLGMIEPQYSSLPDPDPALVDPIYTQPFMDAYMVGFFPGHPDELLPVASNRFSTQPIHFQTFMLEAIADNQVRADWMSASMEWLGFEGDNLYDFMLSEEDLVTIWEAPPQELLWVPGTNNLIFESHGEAEGATRLQKDLVPLGSDWRIGETFRLSDSGEGSHMTLMGLPGFRGLRVAIRSSAVWPGNFEMVFTALQEGVPVFQDSFDGLEANEFFRVHLSYTEDTGSETMVLLTDSLGNPRWSSTVIFQPYFEKFYIEASGNGIAGAQPMSGWIDDLFFEGSLGHDGVTSVDIGDNPMAPIKLLGAQPNPFNPATQIGFELAADAHVRLEIFDLRGRRVRLLLDEYRSAGGGSVEWDGRDDSGRPLTSGVYLAKFSGRGHVDSNKLVLLK